MSGSPCASLLRAGTVIGHTSQGITVDVSVMQTCQQCAQGRGCGMGLVARRQHQRIVLKPAGLPGQYRTDYPLGAQVTFTLSRDDVTLMALLVYALPLVLALSVSGGATWLGALEWQSAVIFFGVLLSGVSVLKYLLRGRMERFRPRLVS